ncbi:MAG: CgeB family protein [Aggregatilineales bacterium]
MSYRVLFVASLHHMDVLRREIAATRAGVLPPLFPTTMELHFWERAMKRRGYVLDVYWRNLASSERAKTGRLPNPDEMFQPGRILRDVRQILIPDSTEIQERNKNLISRARHFNPDILWIEGDNTLILPETIAQIQQNQRCKIFYVNGKSPLLFANDNEKRAAPLYDMVLVNDYYHGTQWMELGAKQMNCLPIAAIDPEFHHPRRLNRQLQSAYGSDVAFVGTITPKQHYSERIRALEHLVHMPGIKPGIWTEDKLPASLQERYRGAARGKEMLQVLSATKISLNIHGNYTRYGGNPRLFESAAAGAFQLVDKRPGILTWFKDNEHLVTFNGHRDMMDKIHYYLANPQEREEIAFAAREHVFHHHTYDHRLSRIEKIVSRMLV